jgi:flagellin-like hook-associated protein FlgL
LEEIASQAQSLANNNPTYSADIALNVVTQTNSYLKSVSVDLNQSINGRYIYSGARYNTQPVQDLSILPDSTIPVPADVPTTEPNLPSYDAEYVDASSTSTAAYATDRATIDTGYVVDYGVNSNNSAFQQLAAGLRYLQAAGNATDAATYKSYMTQASAMLASAVASLQTLHTSVANNMNTMTSQKEAQKTAISNLTEQVMDIQQVDTTQVSVEIVSLEALLQASYSATGSILKMSIVNYL